MMVKKQRLDQRLVQEGLAETRTRAQALIMASKVLVNDEPVTKAGAQVAEDAAVRVREPDHPYVSRAALKLVAGIEAHALPTPAERAMDVGSSTGGFTEVLLEKGVEKVIAVDVGTNQMHHRIRSDERVEVHEQTNARHLSPDFVDPPVDVVTMDLSFISVTKVVPAILPLARPGSRWYILLKPQFEVGPDKIGKGGIVESEQVRQECIAELTQKLGDLGLKKKDLIPSPVKGTHGNQEYIAILELDSSR
jgi:23S rRNA (cytidine1920-2'-O)/16S rRNA (cytidine1409-2'-O)-methyltransferase